MNRDERIQELQDEIDAARARIEQRRLDLESDPIAFDDRCRAERWEEERTVVTKGHTVDLLYRTTERPAPESVEAFSADQRAILMALINELRAEWTDAIDKRLDNVVDLPKFLPRRRNGAA